MKYKTLLKFLHILVYIKRFFWWIGSGLYLVFGRLFNRQWHWLIFLRYKIGLVLKRAGIGDSKDWFLKRDFLQIIFLGVLFLVALPQTILFGKQDPIMAGRKTIAYSLLTPVEETNIEEVTATTNPVPTNYPSWRSGTVDNSLAAGAGRVLYQEQDLSSIVAGGTALMKPIIISGGTIGSARDHILEYSVRPGDSLGGIAFQFGVTLPTLMWENSLTPNSIIRPGDTLRILPVSGIMHTVKKGDTINKIANLYSVPVGEIVAYNHLKADGSDLARGEQIVIPGGVKPQERVAFHSPAVVKNLGALARRIAAPPTSESLPSGAGFVWPTSSHLITQYFGWTHHAIDIGGPWQSPNYAARSGVVEVSQCGWNSGYGCYVIIDHGNGVKTLYGHNAQLLVAPGEEVSAGQPIGLMGNTGNVRGATGIHLHFEVIINGVRVNPLGYVR